ncbi:MAG TPA: helix-turn-helix domain-containing protein [Phycisphaerae bacterium]|nr:helix-turn-helix domain-containing protein [Phycisphaerae bacterium]HRR84869.1 helix-turn-helix domain-containing protein [Phycisphaerae bacterium]
MNAKLTTKRSPENDCSTHANVSRGKSDQSPLSGPKLKESLERLERQLVIEALIRTKGNQSRAARSLGITERIMGLRVKKYGIDPQSIRDAYQSDPIVQQCSSAAALRTMSNEEKDHVRSSR